MSKKDYIKIAATLKECKPEFHYTEEYYMAQMVTWNQTVENFVSMLYKDNPRFMTRRFLIACGYSE